MFNPTDSVSHSAAAPAAGRELFPTALPRHPFIAVVTALIGPLVSLFRRTPGAPPASVEKLKLESYRSGPASPAVPIRHRYGGGTDQIRSRYGSDRSPLGPPPTAGRAKSSRAAAGKGGRHHG